MKHRSFRKWNLGVYSTILLAAAALRTTAEPSAPSQEVFVGSASVAEEESTTAEAPAADTDAPAALVSAEKPLPANIRPSSPVAEVIKLANSGLDESVMLAFVTNSTRTFNVGAEEIIYLNDIGVPGPVVTAMIQRDEALKAMLAAGTVPPPPPMPTEEQPGANPSEAGPSPDQVAPQPMESGAGYAVEAPLTPPDDGADEMFYDSLAPYGNWVDVQGYGRCWQPTAVVVNAGWQPYFDCGRWVYSDCGWYWHSDYSWGWGPFHYGSWFRHAHMGWCWVPGRVWGPSWVSWRYNGRYCGWAPLPPGASFAVGTGLTFHGHHVREGDDFGLRPGHYRFVAWDHFNDRHLRGGAAPWSETHRIYENTTVATRITGDNHTVINNGLPVSRVAAATHRPIHTVALRESSEPIERSGRVASTEHGGQTLSVYRPDPDRAARPGRGLNGMQSRGNTLSTPPTYSNPTPWSSRSQESTRGAVTHERPGVSQNSPSGALVLRGAQSAAGRETPPPNSLVVIGRGNNSTWRPAGRPANGQGSAGERGVTTAEGSRSMPANANAQRNWTGTVSSSQQPPWFTGSGIAPGRANVTPRSESYQPVPRAAAPQVPRYAPTPSYTPAPRSYSAPSYSAPARAPTFSARPAPSAPSAPAPAARSSAPQQSGRNSR